MKKASIKLAFELDYSNDCLKGMSNKIKVIKCVTYGFRDFKKRMLFINKILALNSYLLYRWNYFFTRLDEEPKYATAKLSFILFNA